MRRRTRHNQDTSLISPEEILLDAHNLPAFNPNRLEGRLNKPIGPRSLRPLVVLIVLTVTALFARSAQLMVVEGARYAELSERNRLGSSVIFAERGIIYDRNGVTMAWNVPRVRDGQYEIFDERAYASTTGSGHVLGYVRMPARDTSGVFYRTGIEGVSGVELVYDEQLEGANGSKIVETNAHQEVVSEGVTTEAIAGDSLTLTIDSRLQKGLYDAIAGLAEQVGFTGGAGIMMDVRTGEIVAMTSYPEYNADVLMRGDADIIAGYATDSRTPYLNRTLAGQYTPGSIVKPFLASAALTEGIVRPETSFLSTGSLRLANPYQPGQFSVFTDWRAHGTVDMRRALAVSSNVYFYYIGGGFGGQEGLGITRIEQYMRLYGFGMPTGIALEGERDGIIPSPAWKEKTFPNDPDWRIGDTYNTAIGQYGFQVTPLQAVRAVASIANGGLLLTPRIETMYTQYGARELPISKAHFDVVREGMRDSVREGTAQGLNVPYVEVAGKTGTAELGVSKDHVHSWSMGFYPYDTPRYAFVVLMEHGPRKNLIGGTYVMRQFLDWMKLHTPEYVEFGTSKEPLL